MKLLKILVVPILAMPLLIGCATGGTAGLLSPNHSRSQGSASRSPAGIHNLAQDKALSHESTSADHSVQASYQQTAYQEPAYQQTSTRIAKLQQPASSLVTLGPNDDFDRVVGAAGGVVLVDYYADWCGPCRKQGGILHEMESTARKNGALIVKVNIDQHPELARKFRVSSLPTLMVMKRGQIIERQSGVADHNRVAMLLSR